MDQKLTLNTRIIFTGIVSILIWSHLAWDYVHEGVPAHYLFQNPDLPRMSNWWGGIVLPLLTWFLLHLIHKRMNEKNTSDLKPTPIHFLYRFLAALLFGILMSFLFTIGSDIPGYLMLGVVLLSFFTPLFKPEYFLGFVIGMSYTFGVILPIIFGIVLTILSIIAYKVLRYGLLYIVAKFR